jgi:MFS superfamily sulfate permease-like transporter
MRSVESIFTLQACNEISDSMPKKSDSDQEFFAQGLVNLAGGL